MDFNTVELFENKIAEFFGAPYAVAFDSCTHGIEACLYLTKAKKIIAPKRTYISIPFLAKKMNISLGWKDENWQDYYYLTEKIIDAAVLWKPKSFINGTFMSLSFQFQKHLSLGRGGAVLCSNIQEYEALKKLSYDGRLPNIPWRQQNIQTFGLHYYMTPETAQMGIDRLEDAISSTPKKWIVTDWPDLTLLKVFSS
ncbi:DegT/DnrJ/EryC1/StrS family aminotransferase [Flavobacteriaceae bacterium]|nr:DegT/DnrJ/EryC1/StrS family aminotransferase [Flavobacteriaceae bacterium]